MNGARDCLAIGLTRVGFLFLSSLLGSVYQVGHRF